MAFIASIYNRFLGKKEENMNVQFWDKFYKSGQTPSGSRGKLYKFKLRIVQQVVDDYGIESVVDLGCGDGSQLMSLKVDKYLGLDVSGVAVDSASAYTDGGRLYSRLTSKTLSDGMKSDMAVSLDVLQFLDDDQFKGHLQMLFNLSKRYVLIYAPNSAEKCEHPYVTLRKFLPFIKKEYGLEPLLMVENEYSLAGGLLPASATPNFYLFDLKQKAGSPVEKE